MCGYNQVAIENVRNRIRCEMRTVKDAERHAYKEGKTLENIMMYHDEVLLWYAILEQFEKMTGDK